MLSIKLRPIPVSLHQIYQASTDTIKLLSCPQAFQPDSVSSIKLPQSSITTTNLIKLPSYFHQASSNPSTSTTIIIIKLSMAFQFQVRHLLSFHRHTPVLSFIQDDINSFE